MAVKDGGYIPFGLVFIEISLDFCPREIPMPITLHKRFIPRSMIPMKIFLSRKLRKIVVQIKAHRI